MANNKTNIPSNVQDLILHLNTVSKEHIKDIYHSNGVYAVTVEELCESVASAISYSATLAELPLHDEIFTKFYKRTLPVLVDILLRRKTKREDAHCVRNLLLNIVSFLAQPAANLLFELCDLRNYILLDHPTLKYVKPQMLDNQSTSSPCCGFYAEHGKPAVVVIDGKTHYFWPPDWESVLGGAQAVGHMVSVYINSQWHDGMVTHYDDTTDMHTIQSTSEHVVHLPSTRHIWYDELPPDSARDMSKLSFTIHDVGLYVRVYWSNYHRYYYGKITVFDDATQTHQVLYEDSDSRVVNFLTKEFDVITPPSTLTLPRELKPSIEAVAHWHRENDVSVLPPVRNGITLRYPASSTAHVSYLQSDIIDAFYQASGFTNLFAPPSPNLSLHTIALQLQLLNGLRHKLAKDFAEQLLSDYMLYFSRSVHVACEYQKDINKSDLHNLFALYRDYVLLDRPTYPIQQDMEELCYAIAHRLLECSQLQKRFLGLTILLDEMEIMEPRLSSIINLANKKSKLHLRYNVTAVSKTSILGAAFMETWLMEHRVVELIYNSSLHQELAAKGQYLLIFLCLRDRLTTEHLDIVMKCTYTGHEAVVKVVYSLLLDLLSYMSAPLRMYLFDLLSQIPHEGYTEQYIVFLKQYTSKCFALSKGVKTKDDKYFLGLQILWDCVQDGEATSTARMSDSIIELGVKQLISLLNEEYRDDKDTFIVKCFENIRLCTSTVVAMRILRELLSTNITSNTWIKNRNNSVIEKYNKQFNIIEMFFGELQQYHKWFNDQLRDNSDESYMNNRRIRYNNKRSRFTHEHGMFERLRFLSYLLCNSSLSLNVANVLCLHDIYVDMSTSSIRNKYIEWLSMMLLHDTNYTTLLRLLSHETYEVSTPGNFNSSPLRFLCPSNVSFDDETYVSDTTTSCFQENVIRHIFTSKILDGSLPNNNKVCKLYLKLFLYTNVVCKTIKVEQRLWTPNTDILGLSLLWRIATEYADTDMSQGAMYLLVEICHRNKNNKLYIDFLHKCLNQCENAVNSDSSDISFLRISTASPIRSRTDNTSSELKRQQIERYITILISFIKRFQRPPKRLIYITIKTHEASAPLFQFYMFHDDTVGKLRNHVAQLCHSTPQDFTLSRLLKPEQPSILSNTTDRAAKDAVTLQDAKFNAQETFLFRKTDGFEDTMTAVEKARPKPKDSITIADMSRSFLSVLTPYAWLNFRETPALQFLQTNVSLDNDDSVINLSTSNTDANVASAALDDMFDLPKSPLPFHGEMTLLRGKAKELTHLPEFIYTMLSSNPAYFNLLLRMLDASFNTEINSAMCEAIWEVIQLLPVDPKLLLTFQQLGFDQFAEVMNRTCPYRLLYSLQMIDSFLPFQTDASVLLTPEIHNWVIKFISMGGADYLLQLYTLISEEKHTPPVNLLLMTMLLRVMHKLLCFDIHYLQWQHTYPSPILNISGQLPPGVVLLSFDAYSLIPTLISNIQKFPGDSLVEHTLVLIFGLIMSSGINIADFKVQWVSMVRNICLKNGSRLASCRVILRQCVVLMLKSCNHVKEEISTDDAYRGVSIYEFVVQSVLQTLLVRSTSSDNDVPTACVYKQHVKNNSVYYVSDVYSLIAVLLAIHYRRCRYIMHNPDLAALFEQYHDDSYINTRRLEIIFVRLLMTHNSSESFHSSLSDDILQGILRVLIVLSYYHDNASSFGGLTYNEVFDTNMNDESLIDTLYYSCLYPDHAVAKCQTNSSRKLAYSVLYILCARSKDNFGRLVRAMTATKQDNINQRQVMKNSCFWNYDPNVLIRRENTNVGLVNQGATCYMNSFLQQLFHLPQFSNTLLQLDFDIQDYDMTLLFELQVLFGYLKYSQKKFYNTISFCRNFRDYDDSEIRLGEQKDSNEFASMLFAKIEKLPECKALIDKYFLGKFVWQIISQESSYCSEREEDFTIITVDIKDKKSIEESLDLLVTGELLTGDNKVHDDIENRKVDAIRRCSIRQLPEVLIIHLKRFEFDLETMNRRKLNDYCAFPLELDMYKYTEDGINALEKRARSYSEMEYESIKNNYEYDLKGIVVHTGGIDNGHYYSFIRDCNGTQWQEYNDKTVLPFNVDMIPEECFGGYSTHVGANDHKVMKSHGAYLLIYERKNHEILPSPRVSHNGNGSVSPRSKEGTISKRVMSAVLEENYAFVTDRNKYSADYFAFFNKMLGAPIAEHCLAVVSNVYNALPLSERNTLQPAVYSDEAIYLSLLVRSAVKFCFEVVIHARAEQCVGVFMEKIEQLIGSDASGKCAEMVLDMLATVPCGDVKDSELLKHKLHDWLVLVYTKCPSDDVIVYVTRLIIVAIKALRSRHEYYYTVQTPGCSTEVPVVDPTDEVSVIEAHQAQEKLQKDSSGYLSCVSRMIGQVLILVEGICSEGTLVESSGFEKAMEIVASFCNLGMREKALLLKYGAVPRLIGCVIVMNSRQAPKTSIIKTMMDVIAGLIMDSLVPEKSYDAKKCQLSSADVTAFLNKSYLETALMSCDRTSKALNNICGQSSLLDIIKLVDFMNDKLFECLTGQALRSDTFRLYSRIFSDMLLHVAGGGDGAMQRQDIECVLETALPVILQRTEQMVQRYHENDNPFLYIILNFLLKLTTFNRVTHAFMVNNGELWRAVVEKMRVRLAMIKERKPTSNFR